jgi:hypothetical protein
MTIRINALSMLVHQTSIVKNAWHMLARRTYLGVRNMTGLETREFREIFMRRFINTADEDPEALGRFTDFMNASTKTQANDRAVFTAEKWSDEGLGQIHLTKESREKGNATKEDNKKTKPRVSEGLESKRKQKSSDEEHLSDGVTLKKEDPHQNADMNLGDEKRAKHSGLSERGHKKSLTVGIDMDIADKPYAGKPQAIPPIRIAPEEGKSSANENKNRNA